MGHYLVNLSWRCQLACPYCLLPHIKINRGAVEHPWHEWAEVFLRHVPRGSVIDFAGGEPLLFYGLPHLLHYLANHHINWAITTNAMSDEGVDALLKVHPHGCILINVSDHPGNQDADKNIRRLQCNYPVIFNRVDHPLAGKRNVNISSIIPYQRYREGTELDGVRRLCRSGINHWVADPGGDVFQCNVAMATGRKPMGNLFTGEIDYPPGEYLCDWGCSSCYTSIPGAWQEGARVI